MRPGQSLVLSKVWHVWEGEAEVEEVGVEPGESGTFVVGA